MNKGYWLNVARATHCLNAWAHVSGDCSEYAFMEWGEMDADLAQFRTVQWTGDYF